MPIIKRYPNRKLYDSEAKRYITLEGIAELIRQGKDVRVLDYATGEDLTALTLSQIIFEQEKKHGGFLPHSVLTGLIQAGGDTLGTLRRTLASSLGLLRQVDEEIERRVRSLVNEGELTQEDGCSLLGKLVSHNRDFDNGARPSERDLMQLLADHGVPTREDLHQLAKQLDLLAAKIEEMAQDAK